MSRGLFKRLQDRMCGVSPKAIGRIDEDGPVAGLERVTGHQFDNSAHLSDSNVARLGVLFVAALRGSGPAEGVAWTDENDIGVGILRNETAGATLATGQDRR